LIIFPQRYNKKTDLQNHDWNKKSASSHDEAALLGKKYHIAAKVLNRIDVCKLFRQIFYKYPETDSKITVFG
jgi:hypothetical protein